MSLNKRLSLWAWAHSSSTRKWWITFQISHKGFKDFRKNRKSRFANFFSNSSKQNIFALKSLSSQAFSPWHNQPNGSAKGVVLAEGSMPSTGDNNSYASGWLQNTILGHFFIFFCVCISVTFLFNLVSEHIYFFLSSFLEQWWELNKVNNKVT